MFHCCLQRTLQRIFSESDLCLNNLIPFNRSRNWPLKRRRFCSAQRTTEQCRAGLTKDGADGRNYSGRAGASIITQQRGVCLAPRRPGRRHCGRSMGGIIIMPYSRHPFRPNLAHRASATAGGGGSGRPQRSEYDLRWREPSGPAGGSLLSRRPSLLQRLGRRGVPGAVPCWAEFTILLPARRPSRCLLPFTMNAVTVQFRPGLNLWGD